MLSTGKNVAPTPIEDAFSERELVEQAMVIGDERKFTGALIVPNFEAVRTWADRHGVDLPEGRTEICEVEAVHDRRSRPTRPSSSSGSSPTSSPRRTTC